jgi:Tfp pilus assembly protein PilF
MVWSAVRQAERERARLADEASERQVAAARLAAAADGSLALARELRRAYRYADARRVLAQFEQQIPADQADSDTRARVRTAAADLDLLAAADDVRTWRAVAPLAGGPNPTGTLDAFDRPLAAYREAFARWGMDVTAADWTPAAVPDRARQSEARGEIAEALDDWAAFEADRAVRDRLLAAARVLQPGEWTDRFREPAVRSDPAAVRRLADSANVAALSPGTLTSLAEALAAAGGDTVALLRAARDAHPQDFMIHFTLAAKEIRAGGPREAVTTGRVARALRPDNLAVRCNLATALAAAGEFDEAESHLRAVVAADPKRFSAQFNLGKLLVDRNRLEEAVTAYRRAVVLAPSDARTRNNLGTTLARLNRLPEAVAELEAAAALDPRDPFPLVNLAICHEREREWGKAAEAYREAIRRDPRHAQAHGNLGALLERDGRLADAIVAYRAATVANPTYARAFFNLGLALAKAGDVAGARTAFEQGMQVPADPRLRALREQAERYLAEHPRELAPPPRAAPADGR